MGRAFEGGDPSPPVLRCAYRARVYRSRNFRELDMSANPRQIELVDELELLDVDVDLSRTTTPG